MAKKALLIGINNYPGTNELSYCVNDCDALAKILARNDDRGRSRNFEVKKIPNCPDASTALDSIEELFGDKYVDTALFYFSGHGYIDSNNNGGIVFPDNINPKSIYFGIKMEDIMQIVTRSSIKNKIIILDCCKSGSIAVGHDNKAHLPDGCTILTSSRADQDSVESSEKSHGIFTDLLLQALSGEAADDLGNITVGGIYAYIDRSLGLWGQRPIFKTNISCFESIRNVTPRVELARMKKGLKLFSEVDYKYPLTPENEYTTYPNKEEARTKNPKCINFQILQDLQKIGFVEPSMEELPDGEKFMYFAAMNSKSCRLTKIGKYYWKLYKNGRI